MTDAAWITEAIGESLIRQSKEEASRRRLYKALGLAVPGSHSDDSIKFVSNALQLRVYALLDDGDPLELRAAALSVFQIERAIVGPPEPIAAADRLVRLCCLGIIADRSADVGRILNEEALPTLPLESPEWGTRVKACTLEIWLRLFRKGGWDDLNKVQQGVAAIRASQRSFEPGFLQAAEKDKDTTPAWELVFRYHLAKAAEVLGTYLTQGSVDKQFDIREKLESQFDRAINAASRAQLMEQETLVRLVAKASRILVSNSIWTVTRAVNSRVSRFVESVTAKSRQRPIFEMLPPQRKTLSEEGLLGSSHRAVVVSLPTSSGKTFIAQFRMLQALNQFEADKGWVAYLAPTRALVNQITMRLRRDFSQINVVVEKVSPALEVDGLEADILTEKDDSRLFRVLVTTPEKLDLMLRGGWEAKVGRPLTLVVVDEAHGLAASSRGLKLELLLATINRECRNAQFLLLTPFINNTSEIARWLSPENNKDIGFGIDWCPNDRAIVLAQPKKVGNGGDYTISLQALHTNRDSIYVEESIGVSAKRTADLKWSSVSKSPGKLAAATAQALHGRGTVIVLVDKPKNSWGVADCFRIESNRSSVADSDLQHIKDFMADEMGADFPLVTMLDYGVAVHHSGISEDTRVLVEWLAEHSKLRALVATTTIAQGVNFPVSSVVFASHQYPYGKEMPAEDFWNIAGRAGRVDQEDLGIIALVAPDEAKAAKLKQFVRKSVGSLNSTLVAMVQAASEQGKLLDLQSLSWEPGWSAFLQYLAHTYRQIGNHEAFASQVEQVLRGTLGFQTLRRTNREWADNLVKGVYNYAERLKGKPLKLVDSTGFSWESVSNTLVRIGEAKLQPDIWTSELFGGKNDDLRRAMGVLLEVPELREPLREVTGGLSADGNKLSRIISDWVRGVPLTEMASKYFDKNNTGLEDVAEVSDDAMTNCCRSIFGRLTQTASWGLSALQSLTLGDSLDTLSPEEQRSVRNLPARVYYGVNSDEAIALRMLGVPRSAAEPLVRALKVNKKDGIHAIRNKLKKADGSIWVQALGKKGASYRRAWSIIEGEA